MIDDLRRNGVVAEFDADRGWGTVSADDGRTHFFHCTEISDGSRMIAVGASVTFTVVAGRLGRWEAAAVTPQPS